MYKPHICLHLQDNFEHFVHFLILYAIVILPLACFKYDANLLGVVLS